ncbi:MAG: nucleoside triphosphate pyrophosphohydrolase [Myxococcales bacterium]|nr:nucleoside triphosphate pyrophosphohydrolase [Myxococcales bacterium]MCB9522199.1 nucleoside triphosphate pyrophosphohydrolase [Myxococcales bacterium]
MARAGDAFDRIVDIVARLRAPDGCPWDREQTLETMRPWLVEECYEVLEALDGGDVAGHREELGDLLFQIVFQAQVRHEEGAFDVADVVGDIADKMWRRHPHVFGDQQGLDREAIRANWRSQKQAEKGRESALDGLPKGLPALMRAARLGQKAARVGFDWPDPDGVLDKLDEEAAELKAALAEGDAAGVQAELGDYLFTVVNLCRHLGVDPEAALQATNRKFEVRFRAVEAGLAAEGRGLQDADLDELEARWQASKAKAP